MEVLVGRGKMSEFGEMSFEEANNILKNPESTKEDRFEASYSFNLTTAGFICDQCKNRKKCFLRYQKEKCDDRIVNCKFYEFQLPTLQEIKDNIKRRKDLRRKGRKR